VSFKDPFDYYAKEKYLSSVRQGGLTIYKYTSKCDLEGNWNFHTKMARGLILDDSGKIVARPFTKFWNLNQRPETNANVLPAETPELSDKLDGSLIVTFFNPETGAWQGVTMGSWDNDQTRYANPWLAARRDKLDPAYTYLFEIVGPWNRIVVFYPETRMVLIGVVHTESGEDWSYTQVREFGTKAGLETVRFERRPFQEIDFNDPRITNEEGYVARYSNGLRVKLKYAEYFRLHKILTQLSIKGVWELLSTGQPTEEVLKNVPDEFRNWFNVERAKILERKKKIEDEAKKVFAGCPICSSRKEYAAYFTKFEPPIPGICFRMLDGKPHDDIAWKCAKPETHETFHVDEVA
jgi:RNA ligase